MKKSMVIFLIAALGMSLFIAGCSDDKKSSTDPTINQDDYDYFMALATFNDDGRDT